MDSLSTDSEFLVAKLPMGLLSFSTSNLPLRQYQSRSAFSCLKKVSRLLQQKPVRCMLLLSLAVPEADDGDNVGAVDVDHPDLLGIVEPPVHLDVIADRHASEFRYLDASHALAGGYRDDRIAVLGQRDHIDAQLLVVGRLVIKRRPGQNRANHQEGNRAEARPKTNLAEYWR